MRGRTVAIALVASLAVIGAPASALAAPSARLVYARGPGAEACPDEEALRKAVAARVGYDPFFPVAPLTVSVEITDDTGRLRGRVLLESDGIEKGAQTIHELRRGTGIAARCDDLIASIALAVSVALDAEKGPQPPPPEPEAPPPPQPPPVVVLPAPEPSPPPPAPAPPPRRPKVAVAVAAGGRASYGQWSSAMLGGDVHAEARLGRFGVAIEGGYDATLTTVNVASGATANASRWTGSVLPCAHFGWFVPCAVATFGATVASGANGATELVSTTAAYAAFGARAGIEVPLVPRLHLLGTADVVGIVTPVKLGLSATGASAGPTSGPVDASAGIALLVPIL